MMANLTPASAQAIARLRAYVPPPTRFAELPLSRRAAVLILLYPGRTGDLRVVLTMRASTLSTYAGQAALPGGRADSLEETPFHTARREAFEEIGLPLSDDRLPAPFRVEHLCHLPMNLARTELGVVPCVALLSAAPPPSANPANALPDATASKSVPTAEEVLIPRLDAKEVAAVFTAPFHNFLKATDEHTAASAEPEAGVEAAGFPAEWYRGSWTDWHESRWRMHNFYVPVSKDSVTRPKSPDWSSSSAADVLPYADRKKKRDPLDQLARFRVFGMTARILVDAARVAYGEEPEFEHNAHFGDEEMIGRLLRIGRLSERRKPGDEVTREDLRAAAKLS